MNTPTLYLDCVVLASTAYPSGLSYSLFRAWNKDVQGISRGLLVLLTLPYLAVVPAVGFLSPDLLVLRGSTVVWFAVAVLLAPAALAVEYLLHTLLEYRATGKLARQITVPSAWQNHFSVIDQSLLIVVAIGEEIFYRMIWLGALMALGVSTPLAVVFSSLAYGLNHLGFGWTSVVSKSLTGCIYAGLYLLGGQSIWLPIITHILQNFTLFQIARRRTHA